MNNRVDLQHLTDNQLTDNLVTWHGREQAAQAAVIAHLIEVERRELHLNRGYSSLFVFCTEALGMTEDVAGTRIGAMRVIRDYPCVLEMLADRRLYLSGIRLLRPHLSSQNADELLQAAAGLSKRELEKLLARRFPKQDVKPSVRKLPQKQQVRQLSTTNTQEAGAPAEPEPAKSTQTSNQNLQQEEITAPTAPVPQPIQTTAAQDRQEQRHNEVTPLSATRYKVTFTASKELIAKLEQAQALLSHAVRKQDIEAVMLRALTLLVETEEKRRFGAPRKRTSHQGEESSATANDSPCPGACQVQDQTSEPAATVPEVDDTKAPSRYIPAAVRREVYERDGHRCTYRSPDGKRCNERRFLEFDHVGTPWSQGGAATAENLTLRCGAHNRWAARQLFGSDYVESRIRESKQLEGEAHAQPTK